MDNPAISHHSLRKWFDYVWPAALVLLPSFLLHYFDWSPLSVLLLVIPLVILLPYWFRIGPKKPPFFRYAGAMLAIIGILVAVLWGVPTLLKPYLLFGYAMSITWIIFWQGLYWFCCWKYPTTLSLRTFVFWLLFSLFPATFFAWTEYRTQSLLREIKQGRVPISIQNTEVIQ